MHLKSVILRTLQVTGGFRAARMLTTKGLRILCYHGISLADEHEFLPKLFISERGFRQRMRWLKNTGMPVLSLSEAVDQLDLGTLPDNPVVITMDDGWYGVYAHAVQVLKKLEFPSTLYSATYYSQKGTMVFNVALRYILEKSAIKTLNLENIGSGLSGKISLAKPKERTAVFHQLNKMADTAMTVEERQRFLSDIAQELGLDFDKMHAQRMFTLMTPNELKSASKSNISIQLHTHRHRSLTNRADILTSEIDDNRAVLEPLLNRSQNHFCYPSGIVDKKMLPVLDRLGIKSAVTCEAGFNHKGFNPLLMTRFLDGANIPPLVFEAEMSGILELARRLRPGT